MVSLTLSVSEDIKQQMDAFPEFNWSAVAREAIIRHIELAKLLNEVASESELTDEEAIRYGRELKKRVHEKYHT